MGDKMQLETSVFKRFWTPACTGVTVADDCDTASKGGREGFPLIHHQSVICGVAFARSSLRRIGAYASVVAPWRLAADALLGIRIHSKPADFINS